MLCEWENGLVEEDVAGGEHAASDRVETAVAAMIRGVAEENTGEGARRELVCCRGGYVGVAQAAKYTEKGIVRSDAEQELVGSTWLGGMAGAAVEEVRACVERLSPETGGMEAWKRRARTLLLSVRKTRSALPFCWLV